MTTAQETRAIEAALEASARARKELDAMQAETERFRAALTELATLGEQGMEPNYREWLTFHDKVAKVARDALAGYEQNPQTGCSQCHKYAGKCPYCHSKRPPPNAANGQSPK